MAPELAHVVFENDCAVAVTTEGIAHAELIMAQLREKDFNNIREFAPWAEIHTMEEYMESHYWSIQEAPLL